MTLLEQERLRAAREGDERAYGELVAPYRAGLHAHCSRLLGSSEDAEDALQEALLRAWRGLGRFEGRSSVGTWLYCIATNCALTMLRRRAAGAAPIADEVHETAFDATTPEATAEEREGVELALLVAHERLPARQRAVLILRDALDFSAGEVATSLQTTTASVNSALQRARENVARRTDPGTQPAPATLADVRLRRRVRHYAEAWERADVDGVVAMLAEDAA